MQHPIEQVAISLGGKFTAGGSVTALGSGVAGKVTQTVAANPDVAAKAIEWSEVGVICGVAVGFAGWLTQVYFSWRRDRRETEYHQSRMQQGSRQ